MYPTPFVRALLACLTLPPAASAAAADHYPARPLRMIVPYTAGGATDLLARAVGERLSGELGQGVVVDNRPGANTIIGYQLLAAAAPDGHTLIMGGFNALVMNPLLYRKLPYDVERDLAHVGLVGVSPLVVVVHPSLPVRTLADLVKYAKARPDPLNFASSGNGNLTHIAAELFMSMAGIRMQHVPYKGGAAGMPDQLAGVVQLKFDTPITALAFVRNGRLRAIAVTATQRMTALPDVPTVAEQGWPGYEAQTWFSVATRKGVPEAIVERLSRALSRVVAEPAMRSRFAAVSIELASGTPREVDARVARDRARWSEVIRKAGVSLDR